MGADHGGFELKEALIPFIKAAGHEVQDCGAFDKNAVDYPRIAEAVAELVGRGACDFGVMVDGAGIGSAMTANKVPGVRAAACYNAALARNSREHNDANVLTLGSGQTKADAAKEIVTIFLTTECTADRHRRRVQMIKDVEQGRKLGQGGQREDDMDLTSQDLERITRRVQELLAGGSPAPAPTAPTITAAKLAGMIDHTILKPDAAAADVEKLCREALTHKFFSVCVNPAYVRQAAQLLRDSPVKVCSVVGFPLGAMAPEMKVLETRKAIRDGAREIDMVINVGALKSRDDALVLRDIRGVVEACKERPGVLSKVILETSLLNEEEKLRACQMCMKARADFVKTSTGFSTGGATPEDIKLMSQTVAPARMGVKASGGVRTLADALKMIAAGATRIGSSNSVKMLEEARAAGG